MGNNIKDIQQIKSLIAKGKEMGFLTFEEVNKAVPLEMNTPEQHGPGPYVPARNGRGAAARS